MSLTVFLAFCVLEIGFLLYALFQMVFAALFARQRVVPASMGTLPTQSFTLGVRLATCLVTLVALSYLPALALGPILERVLFDR